MLSLSNPSALQQQIFEQVLNSDKNIVIDATAGSGKSTTIKAASSLVPKTSKQLFVAFNKSTTEDLRKDVPPGIDVSTIHSLGMQALMRHYKGDIKVSELKTLTFTENVIRRAGIAEKNKMAYQFNLLNLINLQRMTMCKPTVEALEELADRYGITHEKDQVKHAIQTIDALDAYNHAPKVKGQRMIDFTDMIYLPLTLSRVSLPSYDIVWGDECQDWNAAQRTFVERLLGKTGRLIAVGDKNQAIYSFAGADLESFEKLQSRANTITLPLSISYRCAKSIVRYAQEVYPDIQPAPNAKDGCVRFGDVDEIEAGDFVLCRNTKPLVVLYLQFIAAHKKAAIIGKDIEKNLLSLLSKVKKLDCVSGMRVLETDLELLRDELLHKGVRRPDKHPRYETLSEKVLVIKILARQYAYMVEVERAIERMFDESIDGIKLMTVHKSKGLEARRVFMIRRDLIPSKFASQEWEFVQEKNLLFVAYTRAKEELIFCDVWRDQEEEETDI